MKIFLDTADTYAIKDYFDTGLIDGVTTNPTLIMKSGRNPDVLGAIQEQLDIIAHEEERIEVIQNHFSDHE